MLGWIDDIEKLTLENTNFRTVAYTGEHTQLTLMRLGPGEEIGWERHGNIDQFLRLEQGKARVEFGRTEDAVDETHEVADDWAFIVPAGVWHDVINTGQEPMQVYAIYAPVHHAPAITQATSEDAEADESAGRDEPPSWSVQPEGSAGDQHA